MGKFFIWLAGADGRILEACTSLSESEKIRFAGIGSLVLIPPILGLLSMSYAVSTISSNPYIYIAVGLAWSLVVLAIDRFLVSTVYKSAIRAERGYWVAVVTRYIFAIFVGIAVSHPLVLLWFDQSIGQSLSKDNRGEISERLKKASEEKNLMPEEEPLTKASGDLQEKTRYRDCLQKLLTAEQSGVRQEFDCGFSSGIPDCRRRCEKIQQQIDGLSGELVDLSNRYKTELGKRDESLKRIDDAARRDVQEIGEKFSTDYLARVGALSRLEKDHPQIVYVKLFMLLFFVFVDILPITMKITTPMGEYEQIRDTWLFVVQVMQKTEREVIGARYTSSTYRSALQARVDYDSVREEISAVAQATIDFIKEQEGRNEIFDRQFIEINKRVGKISDADLKSHYQAYLADVKNVYIEAWAKSIARFRAYLARL